MVLLPEFPERGWTGRRVAGWLAALAWWSLEGSPGFRRDFTELKETKTQSWNLRLFQDRCEFTEMEKQSVRFRQGDLGELSPSLPHPL